MVLAMDRTISLACSLLGHSNRLYRTVCLRVQSRSSSSASRTVGVLFLFEEKYLSSNVAACVGVAFLCQENSHE